MQQITPGQYAVLKEVLANSERLRSRCTAHCTHAAVGDAA